MLLSCHCACRRLTPTGEYGCDGTSLDPLEVMFAKVKSYMLAAEVSFSKKAAKYEAWQQQVRHGGGWYAGAGSWGVCHLLLLEVVEVHLWWCIGTLW